MGRYVTPSPQSAGGRIKKQQEFKVSGTFTPSAALLAAGGSVTVRCIGGGGGGGGSSSISGGGSSGMDITRVVVVTAPVTVTIGAGGNPYQDGGNTKFGTLLTALGGKSGLTYCGGASSGEGSQRGGDVTLSATSDGQATTLKRVSGAGGGNGGGAGTTNNIQNSIYLMDGLPNTGGGGGGGYGHDAYTGTLRGKGGSGLCIVTWEE